MEKFETIQVKTPLGLQTFLRLDGALLPLEDFGVLALADLVRLSRQEGLVFTGCQQETIVGSAAVVRTY